MDMFAKTARAELFPSSENISPIVSTHVETVCLLSKLNTKQRVRTKFSLDKLYFTSAENEDAYEQIKAYVLESHGLKVSGLYFSQVKRKYGLDADGI